MGEITITVEEYKELLECSARVKAFSDYVKMNKYSIDRCECSMFLGFDLPEESNGNS